MTEIVSLCRSGDLEDDGHAEDRSFRAASVQLRTPADSGLSGPIAGKCTAVLLLFVHPRYAMYQKALEATLMKCSLA